jgi:hypothetical protein
VAAASAGDDAAADAGGLPVAVLKAAPQRPAVVAKAGRQLAVVLKAGRRPAAGPVVLLPVAPTRREAATPRH